MEGSKDGKLLRRFARVLDLPELAAGNGITMVESDGFSSWKRVEASAWAFERALEGQFKIGAVFDRDYYCEEEIESVRSKLAAHFDPIHIHRRKEIENYLLTPAPLGRAIEKAMKENARRTGKSSGASFDVVCELTQITDNYKSEITSQLIARRIDFLRKTGTDAAELSAEVIEHIEKCWNDLSDRLRLVPGKEVLKRLRDRLQEGWGVNVTDARIIGEFR